MKMIKSQTPLGVSLIRLLIAAYRRLPFRPFRNSLAYFYEQRRRHNNQRVIATIGGITFELDLREMIDSSLYFQGCYEPYVTAVIDRLVKPGMTIFDIGANIGCHTFHLATLVAPFGNVIAFEPTSYAFEKLDRNLKLNRFENVTLERLALSNGSIEKQKISFRSSWGIDSEVYSTQQETVDFVTVDDYLALHSLTQIDFIKLDVDGFELRVIQGALRTLRKYQPMILMELAPAYLSATGAHPGVLLETLARIGYNFYAEIGLRKYRNIDEVLTTAFENTAINLLASPRSL